MKIKLTSIVIGNRMREADPKKVKELASSIEELGLLHTIILTPDNKLVSGRHRMLAVESLGWDEIEYNVRDFSQLQAELAEIDENIQRSEPSYLERGNMMLRRKEIWEILHPESKAGGDKKSPEFKAKKDAGEISKSFARETADRIGLTERSVRQEMQIAKVLTPEVKETAKEIHLQKSEALRLSKERDPASQKMIIDRIAQRKASSVSDAKQQIKREEEIKVGRQVSVDEQTDFQFGDVHDLISRIAPESVKAIIYYAPRECLPEASYWFEEAARILKPGGILAVMIDPDSLCALLCTPLPISLRYCWIVADLLSHVEQPYELVQSSWMPILIFVKDGNGFKLSSDLIQKGIDSLRADEDHSIQLIGKVSGVGDTVLDPFLSRKLQAYLAPAIGRKFIGFSSDMAIINQAKSHLENVKEVIAAT